MNVPTFGVIAPPRKRLSCSGNITLLFCAAGTALFRCVNDATSMAATGGIGDRLSDGRVESPAVMFFSPVMV